jgi:predicted RNA binding protein YcfA (HicA-like mRNA interferase family)
MASKSSREVIKDLEADSWELVRTTGSHHHFKHLEKPGLVTVPHPKRDLHPKTLSNVYKAAGLPKPS